MIVGQYNIQLLSTKIFNILASKYFYVKNEYGNTLAFQKNPPKTRCYQEGSTSKKGKP